MKLLTAAGLCIALVMSGCSIVAPNYSPDFQALDNLKRKNLTTVAVDPVTPKEASDPVNKISLRGSTLVSPSGSFAQYLENALTSDLKEVGLFDPSSKSRIGAKLLKNDVDVSGFSKGTGVVEAEFKVTRDGAVVLNKTLNVDTQFESSFVGAVAIPRGQAEVPTLFKLLLQKLYNDKEFENALAK